MTKQHDNPQPQHQQQALPEKSSDNPMPPLDDLPSYDPDSLIQQTIRAYDDLGEVTSLHNWMYDALHAQLISEEGFEANYHDLGLSLVLAWLKQRDQTAKDNLQRVLEQLQAACDSTLKEPPALYCVT